MRRYTSIFARVKRIIFSPVKEWKIISEEKRSVKDIFFGYLLPFLIITAVACYIGYGIVGSKQGMFGLVASEKLGFRYAEYYSALIVFSIFLSSLIVSFVAVFFDANKNFSSNFRLLAYSFTPTLTSTIVLIVPLLSPVVLISGFYNLLLIFTGLNRLTQVPKEKKWKYFLAIILTLVAVFFLMSKILNRLILD